MDLQITPKPANEVIAKEGSHESEDLGTLSLKDSLALEMDKKEIPVNTEEPILENEQALNTSNNDVSNELDIPSVSESVSVQEESANKVNDIGSVERREPLPLVPKHKKKKRNLNKNQVVDLLSDRHEVPMNADQARLIEKEKIATQAPPVRLSQNVFHQERREHDNADLLRTNIYYSKKLYEEVSQLRKSIRFQGVVKYFFTAMIVLSSIASLFFGYRLVTEIFSGGNPGDLMAKFNVGGLTEEITANLFGEDNEKLKEEIEMSVGSGELNPSGNDGKYDEIFKIVKKFLE